MSVFPCLGTSIQRKEVVVASRDSVDVTVKYRMPSEGDTHLCHLRATPSANPECSTYSTLELRRGEAPATLPLPMPIVLKPYQHENEQFGYASDYPLDNETYFDTENRPVVSSKTALATVRDGAWTKTSFPCGFVPGSTKVAFDAQNNLYLIGDQNDALALLHSPDGGRTFKAYPIPGTGRCDIEQFSGHNVPDGPPPFVRFTLTEKDPNLFWRRLNDLDLFLPERNEDGTLAVPAPIPVSKKCIGYSGHSGMPSSLVSRGTRVHLVWAEATDPKDDVPGVPTYAATYDRETATLSAPALIGYGPPANDVHNTPCITVDSKGYLHVLVGTHGRTFKYARSLEPDTAAGGWTDAQDVGPGWRQTYVGMVCDQNDTLHLVFRLWRDDTQYFPAGYYAPLAYMSKRPDEPWSEPRPPVIPPFSEYSVYYHRLTIDRQSRLFLSYDYWSTYWFYRTDHRGTRRALLTSPDQGATWRLAGTADFKD